MLSDDSDEELIDNKENISSEEESKNSAENKPTSQIQIQNQIPNIHEVKYTLKVL